MCIFKKIIAVLRQRVVFHSLWPPWTTGLQTPMSMGFSRQQYWSGLSFLPPGVFPTLVEPWSPTLQADSLPLALPAAATGAKSPESCRTQCDPIDGNPPGPTVPGILQARTLEWFAISSTNARKWKVKVKSPSRVWLLATPRTAAYQAHGIFQARVLEWVAIAFSEHYLGSPKSHKEDPKYGRPYIATS